MLGKFLLLLAFIGYQEGDRSPFTGDGVSGGGHLCNGALRVYPHWIDWDVTYSTCRKTPYDVLVQRPGYFVYRLKPVRRACRFRILVVQHHAETSGWESIAYSTEKAWRKQDTNEELPCGGLY